MTRFTTISSLIILGTISEALCTAREIYKLFQFIFWFTNVLNYIGCGYHECTVLHQSRRVHSLHYKPLFYSFIGYYFRNSRICDKSKPNKKLLIVIKWESLKLQMVSMKCFLMSLITTEQVELWRNERRWLNGGARMPKPYDKVKLSSSCSLNR